AHFTGRPDPVRGRGAAIVSFRDTRMPGRRFPTIDSLGAVPFLSPAERETLEGYVTVHGWTDTVLVPKPQEPEARYEDWWFDYETTRRSPVNVNTAPEPVLSALLAGIEARCLFPKEDGFRYVLRESGPVDEDSARRLAARIVERRRERPFYSHHDLALFFHEELSGGSLKGHMPVLMANFNPNARLVKFNCDWNLNVYGLRGKNLGPLERYPLCDKSDLTFYTTELTFASTGCFEITSLGRVLSNSSASGTREVLATSEIRQVVRIFDVLRHDTQRDFERSRLEGLSTRTGPENVPDLGDDPERASGLDGQVFLDDARQNVTPSTTWFTDCDDDLEFYSRFGDRWSSWRLTAALRDKGTVPMRFMRADLRCDRPEYSSEPVLGWERQDPWRRSILNEFLDARYRNAEYKGDLHADGMWLNHYRSDEANSFRVQVYDSVDGSLPDTTGKAIYHPAQGSVGFWIKPDTRWHRRGGAVQALFYAITYAANARGEEDAAMWAPHGTFALHRLEPPEATWGDDSARGVPGDSEVLDVGGEIIQRKRIENRWLFWNVLEKGLLQTPDPRFRRATDWSWPYGDRIFTSAALLPNLSLELQPMEWNHVRIQWGEGNRIYPGVTEIYLNGRRVARIQGQLDTDLTRFRYEFPWEEGEADNNWYAMGQQETSWLQFGFVSFHNASSATAKRDRWFRASAATIDQIRVDRQFDRNPAPADRYGRTRGGRYWEGAFSFPDPRPTEVLSIGYTAYPGLGRGRPRPAYVRLEWSGGGGRGTTPDRDYARREPPAAVVGRTLPPGEALRYRIRFYDNGQTPFVQTPFLDDVVVRYTTGAEVLERSERF
ncbi:MAG: hypothetical protein HY720_24025, partial [Planctomycetes bacterium]|nr:hypothetical protein [Planctomycetota bacterium]